MKELFEVNSVGAEILHTDSESFTLETRADIEQNLIQNKVLRNNTDGYTPSRDLKRIASIPVVVVAEWNRIHGVDVLAKDNRKLLHRLINDGDNAMFRTSEGTF